MNEINQHLQLVRDFHDAFSYTQGEHNGFDVAAMSDKSCYGRMSFIAEELSEILHSEAAKDREGQLDGAVDLAYFTLGTLAILGENVVNPDPEFVFSSKRGAPLRALINAASKSMHTLSYYEERAAKEDLPDVLSLLYAACINYAERHVRADFDGAFIEVHRSNMSKLGADGLPLYNQAGKIEKGPNFSNPVLEPFLVKPDA